MALSMTGYGRAESVVNGRDITIEIKSVNSRYFEYSSRMPRSCAFMDDKLKKQLAEVISRGKVELSLQMQTVSASDVQVQPNLALARSYQEALNQISAELGLKEEQSVSVIARFADVLSVTHADVDEAQLWQDVSSVCEKAVQNFIDMRRVEGEKLKADILSRLATIEQAVKTVEAGSADRVQAHKDKLFARLQTILVDQNIDESRVLTEAAIFADKTAVDEETVRLHSHIAQYREILQTEGPVGRKLDFLTQELNRETNTIGSKCQDVAFTRIVVDVKAEIEKIREQIQNIE